MLASCGNKPNTTPVPVATIEKINGIVVPPEPDPVKNNATLAGIDSNSNGVRDDLERIAAKSVNSVKDFDKAILNIRAEQKILLAPTPKTRAEGLKIISEAYCYGGFGGSQSIDVLIQKLVNTPERKEKLTQFNDVVGAYFSEEVSCK